MKTRALLIGILAAVLLLGAQDLRAEGDAGGSGPAGGGEATTSCPPCQSIVDELNKKRRRLSLIEDRLARDLARETRLIEEARPLRREIAALQPEKDRLNQEIAALQGPLRTARWQRSQLSWLQAWGQGVTAELERLEGELLRLQTALGQVQSRLDELQPQVERIDQELVRVRREIDESEDELRTLRPEVQALERALAECEKQCQTTTGGGGGSGGITVGTPGGSGLPPEGEDDDEGDDGDASTTCVPCTSLTNTINAMLEELRTLKEAKKEAKKERDRLESELSSRRAQIREAQQQIRDLQQQQASQQENVEHLDTMYWKYGSGGVVDNFGSRLEAAEEALEQTEAAIAAAEASIEALEGEIEELQEPYREATRLFQDLARQVREKQTEIDTLFRLLSACENQCRVSTTPRTPKRAIKVGNEYDAAGAFGSQGNDRRYRVLPPGVWMPAPEPGNEAAIGVGHLLEAVDGMQPNEPDDPQVAPEPEDDYTQNPCNQ